ncbi:PH domain-containing protein [Nonomuraea jiangxiensis]|uniref:Putative membrane protein n=1 Tax=Nonomuraea jiangxiensis TaxID=633440 RepID=A0A1G8H1K1_9ACTN|nr:PH domain-containing protein [Nonomuraea jiangxiensis]SDI00535.1 putative membrane protein [Nonomuraea jiangxiensis]
MNGPAARLTQDVSVWMPLSRRRLWADGVKSVPVAVGAVIALVRVLTGLDWPAGAVVAACAGATVLVVAAVVGYTAAKLRTTRWRLTPERLELRSGITVRQHRSIPRERVRSVDLRADPVLRVFRLAVAKVGTGEHAGDGTELVLDGLTRHEAETLRRTLLLQDAEPAGRDGTLAELRWSWIRYAPLSVWTFTGTALALAGLYKVLSPLGLKGFAGRMVTDLWDWVTTQPLVAVPLLVVVNIVVGTLGAGLLFAESWGRYRLEREPGRLRLRRGLLTTRSLTLEERRLRGVEVSEPLLLRLAGGARVKTIATGLGKAAEHETEDVAALTPPLPRALAGRLAADIAGTHSPAPGDSTPGDSAPGDSNPAGSMLGESVLLTHPAAARRRRFVRAVVTAAVLAAGAGTATWLLPWPWRAWVWLAPALALVAGLRLAVSSARSLGHALGERHLISRSGALVRRTIALDRRGISGWTVTESYFQRRSGLLTVSATTAAGKGHYDVVDVGHGEGLELAAHAVPGLLEPFLVRQKQRAA